MHLYKNMQVLSLTQKQKGKGWPIVMNCEKNKNDEIWRYKVPARQRRRSYLVKYKGLNVSTYLIVAPQLIIIYTAVVVFTQR